MSTPRPPIASFVLRVATLLAALAVAACVQTAPRSGGFVNDYGSIDAPSIDTPASFGSGK